MAKSSKKTTSVPRINIGISDKDRAAVAGELSKLLADSYTLYLMTHNFHWNVTGPMFNTLHLMFMTQYTEEWNALDSIAERIRALGHAPGTYREYAKLSSIAERTRCRKRWKWCACWSAPTSRSPRPRAPPSRRPTPPRSTHGRSADAASGRAREECLDAAQSAAVIGASRDSAADRPHHSRRGVFNEPQDGQLRPGEGVYRRTPCGALQPWCDKGRTGTGEMRSGGGETRHDERRRSAPSSFRPWGQSPSPLSALMWPAPGDHQAAAPVFREQARALQAAIGIVVAGHHHALEGQRGPGIGAKPRRQSGASARSTSAGATSRARRHWRAAAPAARRRPGSPGCARSAAPDCGPCPLRPPRRRSIRRRTAVPSPAAAPVSRAARRPPAGLPVFGSEFFHPGTMIG